MNLNNILEIQKILDDKKFYNTFRFWVLVSLAIYLGYEFFNNLFCVHGLLACGYSGFGIILPAYLLFMPFMRVVNIGFYFTLYLISSAFYLVAFYYFAGWLEELFYRLRHKPRFISKRLQI